MKNLFIILIVFIFLQTELFAQIGGVSNSKLTVLAPEAIPFKTFEFEPALGFGWSDKYFDADKEVQSTFESDSMNVFSNFGFRFTYGLFEGCEIGLTLPTNISATSWGAKYTFFNKETFLVAAVAGINVPLGNKTYSTKSKLQEDIVSYGGGVVLGYKMNEKTSVDFDAQYLTFSKETEFKHLNDIYINSEIGYYITEGLQLCGGFMYMANNFDDNDEYDSNVWTLNLGATVETGKGFIMILNMPIDVAGKNCDKTVGMGLAITFAIE